MAYKVTYSTQASIDLEAIIEYIYGELHNPQAAQNFFNKTDETLVRLRDNPFIFPLHHDERLSAKGLRFVTIGSYLMFYAVDEKNNLVNIARIIYGRRNISAII
ncbi:MAG: type II toxin-antitoxin system RelE/ParE family toxin [Defluviitaleaceae bacterium]|nr:type II toxin-antitoxin system RelE/ParE family toxin [Defluviitaleaceae bacterium]MCL2275163.1 type II toxin-antitoxin system RelE/ParE family toxin [Defluviitaleaceae bacterium]